MNGYITRNCFGSVKRDYSLLNEYYESLNPDGVKKVDETAEEALNSVFKDAGLRSLNMPFMRIAEMLFHQQPWPLHKLDERTKNLLKLPQIAKKEAALTDDPDMKKAWNILADSFHLYFSEPTVYDALTGKLVPNQNVYKVDWDFATSPAFVQSIVSDLKKNLLNEPAKRELEKKLVKNYKNSSIPKSFDFTAAPEIEWNKHSYQERNVVFYSMEKFWLNDPVIAYKAIDIPQYRALGNFNISALAKGYVEPHPDGGDNICVSEVHIFVNDHFNFEGGSPLGIWDFKNMRYLDNFDIYNNNYFITDGTFGKDFIYDRYMLYNSDFNKFREKTGYGRNFRIVSPLQKVKEFKPDCWKAQW